MAMEMIPRREPVQLVQWAADCGLKLTAGEALMLLDAHAQALQSTGRIEFESGALEELIGIFADSPHLDSAETLCALAELFYHLKNVTDDCLSDELLIKRMREVFDDCHGSVELLCDRLEGGFSWRN